MLDLEGLLMCSNFRLVAASLFLRAIFFFTASFWFFLRSDFLIFAFDIVRASARLAPQLGRPSEYCIGFDFFWSLFASFFDLWLVYAVLCWILPLSVLILRVPHSSAGQLFVSRLP
jgi:hypothetical protein